MDLDKKIKDKIFKWAVKFSQANPSLDISKLSKHEYFAAVTPFICEKMGKEGILLEAGAVKEALLPPLKKPVKSLKSPDQPQHQTLKADSTQGSKEEVKSQTPTIDSKSSNNYDIVAINKTEGIVESPTVKTLKVDPEIATVPSQNGNKSIPNVKKSNNKTETEKEVTKEITKKDTPKQCKSKKGATHDSKAFQKRITRSSSVSNSDTSDCVTSSADVKNIGMVPLQSAEPPTSSADQRVTSTLPQASNMEESNVNTQYVIHEPNLKSDENDNKLDSSKINNDKDIIVSRKRKLPLTSLDNKCENPVLEKRITRRQSTNSSKIDNSGTNTNKMTNGDVKCDIVSVNSNTMLNGDLKCVIKRGNSENTTSGSENLPQDSKSKMKSSSCEAKGKNMTSGDFKLTNFSENLPQESKSKMKSSSCEAKGENLKSGDVKFTTHFSENLPQESKSKMKLSSCEAKGENLSSGDEKFTTHFSENLPQDNKSKLKSSSCEAKGEVTSRSPETSIANTSQLKRECPSDSDKVGSADVNQNVNNTKLVKIKQEIKLEKKRSVRKDYLRERKRKYNMKKRLEFETLLLANNVSPEGLSFRGLKLKCLKLKKKLSATCSRPDAASLSQPSSPWPPLPYQPDTLTVFHRLGPNPNLIEIIPCQADLEPETTEHPYFPQEDKTETKKPRFDSLEMKLSPSEGNEPSAVETSSFTNDYYALGRGDEDTSNPMLFPFNKIKLPFNAPQTPPMCSFEDVMPILDETAASELQNQSEISSGTRQGTDMFADVNSFNSQCSFPANQSDISSNLTTEGLSSLSNILRQPSPPLTPGMCFPDTPRSSKPTPTPTPPNANDQRALVEVRTQFRQMQRRMLKMERMLHTLTAALRKPQKQKLKKRKQV